MGVDSESNVIRHPCGWRPPMLKYAHDNRHPLP